MKKAKSYEDITRTDFSEWCDRITVLTGGFPCQPFSFFNFKDKEKILLTHKGKEKMEKKIFTALVAMVLLTSCTQNMATRHFGGKQTINLPKGEKLIEATWKEDDLWYLTAPMDSDYVPQTKIFHEDSNFGVMQGTIYFKESK